VPCHRCGARQSDPERGASAWKRGVRSGEQVLVCPECQRGSDWTVAFDSCPGCGSTALVRALGETSCRDCGRSGLTPVPPRGKRAEADVSSPERVALAHDVAAALDRLFGRTRPGG
jgi:hypothetical protein